MINLALQYLLEHDESLEDYEGCCGELTDAIIHWLGEDRVRILYLSGGALGIGPEWDWSYHMVPIIDGVVHDAWFPDIIAEPKEYIRRAFRGQRPEFSVHG